MIPADLTPKDFILCGRRVLTPEGMRPASVRVRGGIIAAVGNFEDAGAGIPVVEAGDAVVMPGLVDPHVHVNDPGRTDWEGFETATRAAAAGGTTTLFDMPLNSIPPTTSVAALEAKLEAAAGRCRVDVGFWGGLVPGNSARLPDLAAHGLRGFKCFLAPSGVPEFPQVSSEDLEAALTALRETDAVLLVHAESAETLRPFRGNRRRYASYLETRPEEVEKRAIEYLIRLSRRTRIPIHILHLSSAGALEALAAARREGLPVTVETCPHYLFFSAEEVPDGATEFKCAPPIRGAENRERLWAALTAGTLDMIASDHSPCPPEAKLRDSGDFEHAWGGIASLELRLSVAWTAARKRGIPIERLGDWLCAAPARLTGLERRKGVIAPGRDADFVLFRPEQAFRVEPSRLHQRHRLTPYAGRLLDGVVEATYLRGEKIYDRGEFPGKPLGRMLLLS
jgi:allantoinase